MKKRDMSYDTYLFHQGNSTYAYRFLGCHLVSTEDGFLYTFRTWAPNADAVFVVGDFTGWDGGISMRRTSEKGIFECEVRTETSLSGQCYKYRIHRGTSSFLKGDPYAVFSRGGADGASIVTDPSTYRFSDEKWLAHRRKTVSADGGSYLSSPLNIYEVHFSSFLRHTEDNTPLSYREMADVLIPYVKSMGYTHIELLPIMEHPFDGSWGYQVCGFYAPTSRFGTPDDFRYFIDTAHRAGVGVILDWVPAHFPKDAWGLYEFDGQPLYEYQGWDRMESKNWGTRFFDLGREEVRSFLISNALYWLREFHADGLRVDAVSAMLYLDFDRADGEWIPNKEGNNLNLEAIAFLKQMNTAIFAEFPDALMIAEEATSYPGITHPVSEGGLGFNLKWNMGFANDFYRYLATDPMYRRYHHAALNFPMMYAYKENYILPISHDEVVHGKRSFLDKAPGSHGEKLATFRASLLFIATFPGKKMLFMGTEYGPYREWDYANSLEWFMLDFPQHAALREYVASLNGFYLETPALWEQDFTPDGFSWIYADDEDHNAVSYRRIAKNGDEVIVLVSFSGGTAHSYRLSVPETGEYRVLFSTDPGLGDRRFSVTDESDPAITLDLPPFSGLVLQRTDKYVTLA